MRHEPGIPRFRCGVRACGYDGSHRLDKMRQHIRNCHLNGHAYKGIMSIGQYNFPSFGDCQFSQDFLGSHSFNGGNCSWVWSGWECGPLKSFLTEDGMGIRKITYQGMEDFNGRWIVKAVIV